MTLAEVLLTTDFRLSSCYKEKPSYQLPRVGFKGSNKKFERSSVYHWTRLLIAH